MSDPKSVGQRVVETLGTDPSKSPKLAGDIVKELMEEMQAERVEKVKGEAREILKQLADLHVNFEKAKKNVKQLEKAYNKSAGKLMNKLNAMLAGQEVPEEPEADGAEGASES